MKDSTRRPRRAPEPAERRLDADRSRRRLLDAALDEFAEKGLAGARVQDIAARAGVNKQLISYYFGGKEGLYRALQCQWRDRETTFNDPSVPFDEIVARYLRTSLGDPRGVRFAAWQGLTDEVRPVEDTEDTEDTADLARRQADGEIGPDLDPRVVLLMCMAMVSAPSVFPQKVRDIFGVDPDTPEFQEHYEEQLRKVIRRLA